MSSRCWADVASTRWPACPAAGAKPSPRKSARRSRRSRARTWSFALFSLKVFDDIVLANQGYVDLILSDAYTDRTYYMGTVDENNQVNFYDGMIRVVDPEGNEFVKYHAQDYAQHIAEHVEPWTYLKFPYLKGVGWKGFVDGEDSGVYCCTPLSRLNAADGMATPQGAGSL